MPRRGEDRSDVGGIAQFQYRTCPAFPLSRTCPAFSPVSRFLPCPAFSPAVPLSPLSRFLPRCAAFSPEIFANQFESNAETAHKICGLAQKWQIGDWMGPHTLQDWMGPPTLRYQGLDGATHSTVPRDWMGPPTLRYQGNVDGPLRPAPLRPHSPVPRKCGWPPSSPGSTRRSRLRLTAVGIEAA